LDHGVGAAAAGSCADWAARCARIFKKRLVSGAGPGEMWITGRASERAKAGLAALGWTLQPKAGARLGE